jgi:hypothetical protein
VTLNLLRSNCDWFTRVSTSVEGKQLLERQWEFIKGAVLSSGEKVRPLVFGGYEGEGTHYVQYGERSDSCCVVAKGEWAETLAEECLLADSLYSRVDAAITFELETEDPDLAKKGATGFEWPVVRRGNRYWPILTVNLAGGQTLYIGNRKQAYLLRLYDKGVQLGTHGAGKLWRYEVQANHNAAVRLVAIMRENWTHREAMLQSWVYEKFREYGIQPAFFAAGEYASAMAFSMKKYDPQSTLGWYRTSVAPSVARLIAEGWESQVYEALGLPTQLDLFGG